MNVENLYEKWLVLPEELKFLYALFNSKYSVFQKTIEGISAYEAYRSLDNDRKKVEFGIYSEELEPSFFLMSERLLDYAERTLPPYPLLISELFREKGLSKEDMEKLNTKTRNLISLWKIQRERKEIIDKYGLESQEFKRIEEESKKHEWKTLKKIMLPMYGLSALQIMLYSNDPAISLLYGLSFPLVYNVARYVSFRTRDRRVKRFIDESLNLAFLLTSPEAYVRSILEFKLVSSGIDKLWPYIPRCGKRFIYWLQNEISGIKGKSFDEEEIRELLCNVKVCPKGVDREIVEKFIERVELGIIEIEDPRKKLLNPYSHGYSRRMIVAFRDGNRIRIIDKEFVRKLASIEGTFMEEMEKRIELIPEEYLGVDVKDGRIYYVRDLIGILPCKLEGLTEGVANKEVFVTLLRMRGDSIFYLYPEAQYLI